MKAKYNVLCAAIATAFIASAPAHAADDVVVPHSGG